VKAVIVEFDELISRISEDHKIQKKVEEPLSINIFTTSTGTGKSTTGLNGQFVFSQVLIDCLLRLKSTQTDKNELIDCCKNEYKENYIELDNLREFEQGYSPNKVLWWYTRESFFYKILNAALRSQNIHIIFLFRECISDIHHQLEKYQSKNILQVYRSQLMSRDEVDNLKKYIGQFISVNSFFSTSKKRTTALFFLGDTTSSIDLERVLFEITADPKVVNTKPFADISKHSEFADELEVLFMLGSIFRLESINRNDNQIWIIRMTLCSDDEHDLKQVLMYMKQQIGSGETNLRILGKILSEMGKFDLAETYYNRLLKELSPNDLLLGNLYEDLGKLASQRGDYDMSVQWHQKSLAIKNTNQLRDNLNVGERNNSISKLN
jgi:tetratricopeptide (TPR) repeat protein